MTSVNNESQKFVQEDEINLIDLIVNIWQGKWVIIASTIFATIIGVGYYLISPTQIQANIDLQALTQQEATWLGGVSNLPDVELDDETATSFYTSQFNNGQFIEQFINEYINSQFDKPNSNEPKENKDIAFSYNITKSTNVSVESARLTFASATLSSSELKDFIVAFLMHIQKASTIDLIEYIQVKSDQYKSAIQQEIDRVNLEKLVVINSYQTQLSADVAKTNEKIAEVQAIAEADIQARAAKLKNQIAIARKLNIEKPGQIRASSTDRVNLYNYIETAEMPLFMRGYIALEEELDFIENRTDLEIFSKELRDLKIKMGTLENRSEKLIFSYELADLNRKLLELENEIANSTYLPFLSEGNLTSFSPEFVKVTSSLELGTNFITKTSPRKLIIILAIFAGGFIGIVLVFMLSITRAVQNKLKLAKS